jgi:hypothetical protein
MYILKGFMSMPSLANDAKQEIADFGELSTYTQTFTRDIRNYAMTAQPDVELFVFKSIDEMENRTNPSVSFRTNLLAFGQWVFNQYQSSAIPPERNKSAFVNSIRTQFPAMTAVTVGELLVSSTDAGKNCPDYVQFNMLDGIYQYSCKLWFSDSAMRRQYEDYEIFIIPPVPDISQLINSKPNVYQLLTEQSVDLLLSRITAIAGDLPYTALHPYPLTWHDPDDTNATLATTWTAVIYGAAGFDTEAIKEKIREYIADHSDYDKWNEIYPDLYIETEFAFFPMWDKYALDENALQVGLYSSLIKQSYMRTIVKQFLPAGYTQSGKTVDQILDEGLYGGVASYRSLAFGNIGNPNNKDGNTDLQDLYPDINLAIDSLDNDFGRMSLISQEFSLKLNAALNVAREYSPNEPIEAGYSRVVRRSMYFVSFKYNDYDYIILSKYSFDKATSEG